MQGEQVLNRNFLNYYLYIIIYDSPLSYLNSNMVCLFTKLFSTFALMQKLSKKSSLSKNS